MSSEVSGVNNVRSEEAFDENKTLSFVDREFNANAPAEEVNLSIRSDGSFNVSVRGRKYILRGTGDAAMKELLVKIKKDIGEIKISAQDVQRQILAIKAETSRLKILAAERSKQDVQDQVNRSKGK